ncbi:MAG: NUDIX hydrolase [Sandaracinaceae bacterium]|nr:NUDIX hydrolase [Sandaracinaceae bacterium]
MRRVVATVVLVVFDARALVLRRRPDDRSYAHAWCLPGGSVEGDETIEQTALRETEEETGLVVDLQGALGMHAVKLARRSMELHIHRFVASGPHDRVRLSEEHVDHRWLTRELAARAARDLPGGLAGEATAELLDRFARGELP